MKSKDFCLSLLILFFFVCSCNDIDDLVSSNNEEENVVDNSYLSDMEMVAIKTLGRSTTSIGSEEAEQIACDFFNKKVKNSSVQLKSFSTNTLDASCSWYLPDVFDCSEGYNRYGDSFVYGNYSSDKEYSRVHIATNIHPLR